MQHMIVVTPPCEIRKARKSITQRVDPSYIPRNILSRIVYETQFDRQEYARFLKNISYRIVSILFAHYIYQCERGKLALLINNN